MKVIGICGSPRKGGNTEIMLKRALKAAESKGAETDLILLAGKTINHFDPDKEIKDDMDAIIPKIKEAENLKI